MNSSSRATLHMLWGNIASGKSTLARELATNPSTILIAEDDWIARLYSGQLETMADYLLCSKKLREVVGPHVVDLLRIGISVALDFQANTPSSRLWMRRLFEAAGADHRLHVLDVPTEICRARLYARNAAGTHDFDADDALFDEVTSYIVPPDESEGFTIVRYYSANATRNESDRP
jgi:predicted kinase